MENKKKSPVSLIVGGVLIIIGIIAMIMTRSGGIAEDSGSLQKVLYSVSIIAVIIGAVIFTASFGHKRQITAKELSATAIMAALCYVGFALFKIDIPVPGSVERTAFHLGNVFCVLGALLFGGLWGGLAGAIGMTLADLMTGYVTSAPKTFFLKLCIGLITGLVAYKVLHLDTEKKKSAITWKTVVSAAAGMAFNVVADPIVGYFYKRYLFGLPQDIASTLAKIESVTTLTNAVVAVIVAAIFYLALRPAIRKMGIFRDVK